MRTGLIASALQHIIINIKDVLAIEGTLTLKLLSQLEIFLGSTFSLVSLLAIAFSDCAGGLTGWSDFIFP
ncbi:unnamed protein product [Meloidogyne enterolobii]|uniref:Uncharacterized protein n=1 Tax=Meloidogyne enterolobii TaxID=390850 RepID=A0ACB0Z081_MELEN